MKTVSLGLLMITVFLFSCDDTSNIIDSINTSVPANHNKITTFNYELIPLPPKSLLWSDSLFTVNKEIDGALGGRIIMDKYYIAENGDSVMIFADLRIPEGAFTGVKTISLTADKNYATIHFSPSIVFEDTLKLTQSFRGMDLRGYSTGTLDFVFIDELGIIELIKKNGIQVNIPHGFVRVQNAKLTHFSRYGWIRGPEGLTSHKAVIVQ